MEQIKQSVAAALSKIQNQTTQKASKETNCCICFGTVILEEGDSRWFELDIKCENCQKQERLKAASRQNEAATVQREALLSKIPTAFRTTERNKLPFPDKLDSAMRWEFGPKGLLLHGQTGCGKSRIIWKVAEREVLAGRSLCHVNSFELSRYPSLFMAGDDAAGKFADKLVKADVLLLDDVFKAKPTERVEELLFGVIDERGSWERPCLITLNDTGESLGERLSIDRGPALIRRLREYCYTIQFDQ